MAAGTNPPQQTQANKPPKPARPPRPPTPQPQGQSPPQQTQAAVEVESSSAIAAPEDLLGEDGRGPQTHVVVNGDEVREPDELELLQRQKAPRVASLKKSSVEQQLHDFIQAANDLKVNEKAWKELSPFTKYAIVGAKVLAQEVLGEKDDHGQPASMRRTLGFDIATGRTIGHGT